MVRRFPHEPSVTVPAQCREKKSAQQTFRLRATEGIDAGTGRGEATAEAARNIKVMTRCPLPVLGS